MLLHEKYYGSLVFSLYALYMKVPGSNALYRNIFLTISILALSLSTLFQALLFVTQEFSLQLFVEVSATFAGIFGCLLYILYLTFGSRAHYQRILRIMQEDLREAKGARENFIIIDFAIKARKITSTFLVLALISLIGVSMTGFLSTFLDILIPVNKSRERELLYEGEMFIDQEKYFYHIYFVEVCTAVAVTALVVVSECIALVTGMHACGMAATLGYQLLNITEVQERRLLDANRYERLIIRKMQQCVRHHQKILELAMVIAEFYDIPLTLILTGSFCTLTMSLVNVTDPTLIAPKMIIYTIGQFIQLFLVSCLGQKGIDASLQVSDDAYFAKWDKCPARVRRLLMLVILRSTKPCKVVARGIYVLSVENFMSVIHTITSFFMVFRHAG